MTALGEGGADRRLLWIHQNFVTARQPGNSRPVSLIAALLAQGWQIDIVTTQGGYLVSTTETPSAKVMIQREGGLTIHRLPIAFGGMEPAQRIRAHLRFLPCALRYAGTLERADVLYASTPPLLQVLASVLLSVRWGVPLILEVRDLWPAFLSAAGLLHSRFILHVLEGLETFYYRYADHCIAVTPSYAPYVQARGASPHHVTVAPTGADPYLGQVDKKAGRQWRRQQGLEDRFVIVYTGSLQQHYGLDTALAAAEQLQASRPELIWVFAGAGGGRAKIEKAAARLRCVRYLGNLPRDALGPLYKGADAGLVSLRPLPAFETVIPGKLLDYLAAGLPILSLINGQTGALVNAAQAGIVVQAATPAHLAVAVCRLADLPVSERAKLGEQGQKWALTHMNCDDLAQIIVQVLDQLPSSPGRLPRLVRCCSAGLAALHDCFSRSAARVNRRFFGPRRAETLQPIFTRWLQARHSVVASSVQPPPPLPSLLSQRADSL